MAATSLASFDDPNARDTTAAIASRSATSSGLITTRVLASVTRTDCPFWARRARPGAAQNDAAAGSQLEHRTGDMCGVGSDGAAERSRVSDAKARATRSSCANPGVRWNGYLDSGAAPGSAPSGALWPVSAHGFGWKNSTCAISADRCALHERPPPGRKSRLDVHQLLTARTCHSPGTPFSAWRPRSSNSMPDPATRSRTVLVTSTSPGPARAATRAPM